MYSIRTLAALAAITAVAVATPALAEGDTASTTGTAAATVVQPITLSKSGDLNFGVVTPNGGAAVVTISTEGARSGPTDVLVGGGTTSAAAFAVGGDADRAFTFTLPAGSATLTSGADTLTVDNWTSDAPATIVGGNVSVNVGGSLNLAAAQPAGAYAGTFSVTATYN